MWWRTKAEKLRAAEKLLAAQIAAAEREDATREMIAAWERRAAWEKAHPKGWPPLLIKALTHSSRYVCLVRNGDTVEFGLAAAIDGTIDWADLKPADGCAAAWPGAQLRVADIVWIGEKPADAALAGK